MIKLRKSGKGYMPDCPPNWVIAITKTELKALKLLLLRHYIRKNQK